ncbi:hypothetical protein C162_03092 [Paenibacillus sp. FSL R7-269]|nr:phage tail protein [Paenibacillus sp. FSL R7-269]ETT55408.1 hypothetical protein C162_03092 [Paenibacillus sp. FSL R7-269]
MSCILTYFKLTNLISGATGGRFTFSIDDTFDLCDVKDFGQGNCLQALNKVVEMYGCEIEADNFVIHLKKQIGKDDGMQYRIALQQLFMKMDAQIEALSQDTVVHL